MKQQLGKYKFEITRLQRNGYLLTFEQQILRLDGVTEEDIDQLINLLRYIKDVSPMETLKARENNICRICKNKIHDGTAIRLDFGKEFAHERCLGVNNE